MGFTVSLPFNLKEYKRSATILSHCDQIHITTGPYHSKISREPVKHQTGILLRPCFDVRPREKYRFREHVTVRYHVVGPRAATAWRTAEPAGLQRCSCPWTGSDTGEAGPAVVPSRGAQPRSRHDCTGSVSGAARDRLVCREPTREAPVRLVGARYGSGSATPRPATSTPDSHIVRMWFGPAPTARPVVGQGGSEPADGAQYVLRPPPPRLLPPTDTQGRRGFATILSFGRLGRL